MVNVAKGKPTGESSNHNHYDYQFTAARAIDGLRNGQATIPPYTCFIAGGGYQYMYINLLARHFVRMVKIMPRYDCCSESFDN